jgi:hypothetical protein
LRSPIKGFCAVFAAALALVAVAGIAAAYSPSVAELDATARAAGNRRDLAQHIGDAIFSVPWPAEVSQISANELAGHLIVGIRVLGVKFHRPLTREGFVTEVVALVERAFASVPGAEEIDLWTSVPISVAKGVIVSGDLAKPTSRTVFSLSARRGESPAALRERVESASGGVFWDAGWVRAAFKASDV